LAAPELDTLLKEIRACTVCASAMPHAPRPIIQAASPARIMIIGQAPGTRVHASGVPFTDPSGDRLRAWMGVDESVFYDTSKIAIVPMGFCFPGLDAKGADLPPRRECAPLWQDKIRELMPNVELTLLVGMYAQRYHLGKNVLKTLTDTVNAAARYGPDFLPLPHPSWRNSAWLKRNPWFGEKILPLLRRRVSKLLTLA
jgi:uracil-DNA glycosylase